MAAFAPDYFAIYNPVTARDMVSRVPGFSIEGGGGGPNFGGEEERRGFGGNEVNVLINGERPSSKANIEDQLGRIPAANVLRLELISGAGLAEVDVRGQTQIVNVVLLPGASVGAATTYIAELKYNDGPRVGFDAQATRSFQAGGADIILDVQLPSDIVRGEQVETVRTQSGDIVEVRDEFDQEDRRDLIFNAAASWAPGPRDTVNLNAEISPWVQRENRFSDVSDGAGDQLRREYTLTEETDAYSFELGADWERRLTPSTSVKILGLWSHASIGRSDIEEAAAPSGAFENTIVDAHTLRGERIGRGTWTWRANDAHTLEAGVEGAFNFREAELDILIDDGGGFVPVELALGDTRVEEVRGEVFVVDVWNVNPRLTLESGFTFEASQISQSIAGADPGEESERDLSFPKPRLTATYARDAGDQFRFVVERDVAQLNFGDFVSSVSLGDNRVEAGNRNLEPARTWKTSVQWERRFGDRGALTLEAFYDQIEGVQDRVPVLVSEGDPTAMPPTFDAYTDAAGNLGDGTRYGLRIDATLPLEFLGLSNAELRMRGKRQRTEVEDPVTGATRAFSFDADWDYFLDFRQDLPALDLSWGAEFRKDALRDVFRATEVHTFGNLDGGLDVYLETTRFFGVTTRFQVANANDSTFTRRRSMWGFLDDPNDADGDGDLGYVGELRTLDPPDLVEERIRTRGRFYSVRFSGTF